MAIDTDRLIREAIREAIVLGERLDPRRAGSATCGVTLWPLIDGPEALWGNRWAACISWDGGRDETEAGEGDTALSAIRGLVSYLEVLVEKEGAAE